MPKSNGNISEPVRLRYRFGSSKKIEIMRISLFTAQQNFTFLLPEPFLLPQELTYQ